MNNQALELKDAYLCMCDTIEEMERFKVDMIEQLRDAVHQQSMVTLKLMKTVFLDIRSTEELCLEQIQELLKSPQTRKFGPINPNLARIQIEDMEDANLSEYDGSPTLNPTTIKSDLLPSPASHKRERTMSLSSSASHQKLQDLHKPSPMPPRGSEVQRIGSPDCRVNNESNLSIRIRRPSDVLSEKEDPVQSTPPPNEEVAEENRSHLSNSELRVEEGKQDSLTNISIVKSDNESLEKAQPATSTNSQALTEQCTMAKEELADFQA